MFSSVWFELLRLRVQGREVKAFQIFARYSLTYRPVAVFILIKSDHSPGQLTAFRPAGNQYEDVPVRVSL